MNAAPPDNELPSDRNNARNGVRTSDRADDHNVDRADDRSGPAAAQPAAFSWFDRHLPTYARIYRRSRIYRVATGSMAVLLPVAIVLAGYIQYEKFRYDPRRQPAGAVTVLVTATCPFCRELEAALHTAAIAYRRVDVEAGDEGRWAYTALRARGVPVTVVGADVIYGLRTRELRATLERAGVDVDALHFEREFERDSDGASSVVRG